ncbi:hypothetical protein ACCO45_000132 [Purpureocillium lilacinum]|uniref:Uncharacterized protein n=1 Tax=Purpureocillium lilacinum TaxID=33203 RepID=A0ACC4E6K1_PURLI
MADEKRQRRTELDKLQEELGPYFKSKPSPRREGSMSQRNNRSGRGSGRNGGGGSGAHQQHGEEVQIWDACKSQMAEIVAGINAENNSLGELVDMDKRVGAMDPDRIPGDSLKQMEQLCRKGVKFSEANIASLKAVTEQLKILKAVVRRAADVGVGGGSGGTNKSKVVFSKGDAVAFKPKAANGEQSSDWILGEVAAVMGEGKSRRYKVLDIEPDDQSKQKEYRSSASSMIAITPESQAGSLRDWDSGKMVLALYPQTTTFYKAEVDSMADDGRVNLRFEGENDSTMLQQVERRFVIEYRA